MKWLINVVCGLLVLSFVLLIICVPNNGPFDEQNPHPALPPATMAAPFPVPHMITIQPSSKSTKSKSLNKDLPDPTDEYYGEGYDDGFEQGEEDARLGRQHGDGYDQENVYSGHAEAQYEAGYEDGYDDAYSSGGDEDEEEE